MLELSYHMKQMQAVANNGFRSLLRSVQDETGKVVHNVFAAIIVALISAVLLTAWIKKASIHAKSGLLWCFQFRISGENPRFPLRSLPHPLSLSLPPYLSWTRFLPVF